MPQRNVYVSASFDALLDLELRADPDNTPGKLLVALARATYLGEPTPRTLVDDVIRAGWGSTCERTTEEIAAKAHRPVDLVSDALRLLTDYFKPARSEDGSRVIHGKWIYLPAQEDAQVDEGKA